MAKDKKSVLLYCDIIHTVSQLTDEEAGKLFKHYLAYVNDLSPKAPDKLTQIIFEPIKQTLKRDLIKYGQTCGKNRENVLKRWNKNNTTVYDRIPTDTKHTDKDKDKDKEKDKENTPLILFSIEHCIPVALNDNRWVKANKATETLLKEFNVYLEKQGIYEKNPADYKSHFSNLSKKQLTNGIQNFKESEPKSSTLTKINYQPDAI